MPRSIGESSPSPRVSLPERMRISWLAIGPSTITAVLIVAYLLTLTADYFWDGITFALQIEKVAEGQRGISLLFHQNHLFYEVFGYLLYGSARFIGLSVRALSLLQLANSLFGAIAVGVFFRIAYRLTANRYAAVVSSAALAFSATWWKLSTDADAYVPAVLLILLCLDNLLGDNPRWIVAGLTLGGAMLIHELASLFCIGAIAAVFANDTVARKARFAVAMCAVGWSLCIGAYYCCAVLLHGIARPSGVLNWVTTNPSLITPSLNPVPGILMTPRANIDLVIGHSVTLFRQQAGWFGSAFGLLAVLTALAFLFSASRTIVSALFNRRLYKPARETSRRFKRVLPVLIAWVIPYLAFLCFFEAQDPYLRLFYAPALALAFCWVVSRSPHRVDAESRIGRSSGRLALKPAMQAVAALALINFCFFIEPHEHAESNPLVSAARGAASLWNERTVIYFTDHTEADTTFEYFNLKTRWKRLAPAALSNLDGEIESVYRCGGTVWLNQGAADSLSVEKLADYPKGQEIRVEVGYASARYVQMLPRGHTISGFSAGRTAINTLRVRGWIRLAPFRC